MTNAQRRWMELLFGLIGNPASGQVRMAIAIPPREALRMLLSICEDLREAITKDTIQSGSSLVVPVHATLPKPLG